MAVGHHGHCSDRGALVERYHAGLLGGIGLAVFASGLFLLAVLPANPSDVDIIWRMILCGAGFGLFQTPNNHTIISAAPQHRSGGASGMLGTARLLGQTSGAALVALMFNMFSTNGTHASLILAGCFASIAALVSLLRVTQKVIRLLGGSLNIGFPPARRSLIYCSGCCPSMGEPKSSIMVKKHTHILRQRVVAHWGTVHAAFWPHHIISAQFDSDALRGMTLGDSQCLECDIEWRRISHA